MGGGGGNRREEKGGFAVTHMLHSIIPSFVSWTMRVRGAGFKKDRHTVGASDTGETPADPQVKRGHFLLFILWFFQEDATFCQRLNLPLENKAMRGDLSRRCLGVRASR